MPRYYLADFDEKFCYVDSDGHGHDVPLRDLSVEQLLRIVRYYKISKEASWNESTLTERFRVAMPRWNGDLKDLDHAIRWYWRDRIMQARPFRDV
jgi:hypothetical protein